MLSYLVDNYHIELPDTIPHDIVLSSSFIVESDPDKIEKRVLIVLQNEQEGINSAIEASVNESSYLYALILTVNSNLDNLLTRSLGEPIESEDSRFDELKSPKSEKENSSKTRIFAQNKRCIRMTIPSDTDAFDDALNCIFMDN